MTSSKEYRPVVNLPDSRIEKIYDTISLVCVIIMILGSIAVIGFLPDRIPIHWNLKGEVDGYGGKLTMLILPLLSVLFFFMFSWIYKIPHKYNYLRKLTPENYEEQYLNGRKLLRIVHLISQITFVCLFGFMIKGALSGSQNIPSWFIALILVATIGIPVLYAFKSAHKN